jgi:hypothetical protein
MAAFTWAINGHIIEGCIEFLSSNYRLSLVTSPVTPTLCIVITIIIGEDGDVGRPCKRWCSIIANRDGLDLV